MLISAPKTLNLKYTTKDWIESWNYGVLLGFSLSLRYIMLYIVLL